MDPNNYQPDVGMIMQLGVQTEPLDVVKMPTIFRPDERSSVNMITDPWPWTSQDKIFIPQYGT